MIGADPVAAKKLADTLASLQDFSLLGADVSALAAALTTTVAQKGFPGAVVPGLDGAGALCAYVAASTMTDWRRLRSVLQAFAGPTLTSFNGMPGSLPVGDPIADAIAATNPAVTALVRIPADPKVCLTALRAMVRTKETFARAPNLQRATPEPTSLLLARFQDHLNVGRRDAAVDVLAQLKRELRLDSLNLKFLEVQLHAAFSEWDAIVGMPAFVSLTQARRTPTTTAILLEALYHVYLAASFDTQAADETLARFKEKVQPLAQPLLTMPAPANLSAVGWRLFGLEVWATPSRGDIADALVGRGHFLGWIADRLPNAAARPPKANTEPALLDEARAALVQVDGTESVNTLAVALAALARLSPEQVAALRETELFRSPLHATEQSAKDGFATSWVEWLDNVVKPDFTHALDIARQGKDEWPIETTAADPLAIQALVSALNRTQGNDLAAQRSAQALPFMVAWLRRDPEFPRAAMVPLYGNVLTLFALGSARGNSTYESSQILVSALLRAGIDKKAYQALIDDVKELAGEGFGIHMIYWMLEVIEDFMLASAPDANARQDFLYAAMSRIAPLFGRLSSLQRVAVGRLAEELSWPMKAAGITNDSMASDNLAKKLQGLRIAIYSLTETSSRQAKAAIEEVAPSATVDCNADHGGTAKLRSLAENADLFVLTWLSAKHAATDFIRQYRGTRPLLYAQGRGFSSILRAIESHFATNRE